MDEARLVFEPFMDEDVRQFIIGGVDNFNIAKTGISDWSPANFVVRMDGGEVVGGLLGFVWGGWLQISYLWVATSRRGQGWGSRLLAAAEAYARDHGCIGAALDTFSFQARPFYERHGYVVVGEMADFPPGHCRYFLQKRLD